MKGEFSFKFGPFSSRVFIRRDLPSLEEIAGSEGPGRVLPVCDLHTEALARRLPGASRMPLCVLPAGEEAKNWGSVEKILRAAREAGLGRDGLFAGIGGGVVTDLSAFAASVYMRGAAVCLLPTSLLGMVDAALGGKTGFDLFGIKNLAGTFFPARHIYICRECLDTLPEAEWKSGMAELIKTAVLEGEGFFSLLKSLAPSSPASLRDLFLREGEPDMLLECIARAVELKGRIVEADPAETGTERALLNLGHTFAHALESSLGLGRISHGEAVAWGTVRACELGRALGITPPVRGAEITALFRSFGYELRAPHPLLKDTSAFMRALGGDKKIRAGKLRFVVPGDRGAVLTALEEGQLGLLEGIIKGSP